MRSVVVTNTVVTSTTEYYGLAVEQMRAAWRRVVVDIEGEMARPTGRGRWECPTPSSEHPRVDRSGLARSCVSIESAPWVDLDP